MLPNNMSTKVDHRIRLHVHLWTFGPSVFILNKTVEIQNKDFFSLVSNNSYPVYYLKEVLGSSIIQYSVCYFVLIGKVVGSFYGSQQFVYGQERRQICGIGWDSN